MKMMKKLKKQGGFSLVELIVVIVIILVLAAVMVPNVSKYIDMASQSNTKNNAATLLTQAQAETAEAIGKAQMSGKAPDFKDVTVGNVTVVKKDAAFDRYTSASSAKAEYFIDKNQVVQLSYADGSHYINWTLAGGWEEVDYTASASQD